MVKKRVENYLPFSISLKALCVSPNCFALFLVLFFFFLVLRNEMLEFIVTSEPILRKTCELVFLLFIFFNP